MATTQEVDVVVIGGGSTGENVADYAHRGGLEVLLVETGLVGGECSYYACMPSKALLRPGQAVAAARRVDGAAQAVTGMLDPGAVLRRRTTFTHGWDDSSQVEWAEGAGLELVRGRGRITGERQVTVVLPDGGERVVNARHGVVVATGSEPARPPVDGLEAPGTGPPATRPARARCRAGWSCSVAAWRGRSCPRPTPGWVRR
ncbi:FAD-dependent oxidoreductase [Georgenia sp. SUBG003]|uniref:FAD-dependent oxidoreductase n=1 Tax=Georgenia sp. SUBG003 TaxID=1497974 RepID=UPI003AB26E5E